MRRKINIVFRIPRELQDLILKDLRRPHPFAFERVGFLSTKSKYTSNSKVLILAIKYTPVLDNHYINDKSVGAKINSEAIRSAMQSCINDKCGGFHVHLHDHISKPYPSGTDEDHLPSVASSLSNIASKQANGFLILSKDSFYARVKLPEKKIFTEVDSFTTVGYPMAFQNENPRNPIPDVYDRQSFLGPNAQSLFSNVTVGVVGYGGGGSHIGQQLAHLGIKKTVIFDNDKVEASNLNRLIGAWFTDIKNRISKTTVAKRLIKKILPSSEVILLNDRWQSKPELLQGCDIVFGCVDSYTERQQLEAECRRYLIPYIDIGMDVHKVNDESSGMSGQVILSFPAMPCMSCFGFITENKLAKEAAKYGNAGGRPQVVWPNGVLASTAVGVMVDLITGWSGEMNRLVYLAYDGNTGTIQNHIRIKFAQAECKHYPLTNTGPPTFSKL